MSGDNFVREARKQLGLTQAEFATRLDMSKVYISMLEREARPMSAKAERRIKKLLELTGSGGNHVRIIEDTSIPYSADGVELLEAAEAQPIKCPDCTKNEAEIDYLRRQNNELTATNQNLSETLKTLSGTLRDVTRCARPPLYCAEASPAPSSTKK